MTRFGQGACVALLLVALAPGLGAQDVYLRLTDYAGNKTPLSVGPFTVSDPGSWQTAMTTIETVLENDLDYSLYFDVLADTTLLVKDGIKTGVLIRGANTGDQLKITIQDFASGTAIAELNLTIAGNHRTIAHNIADEVIIILTGEKGIASTRIVFSYRSVSGKELAVIDYDGAGFAAITRTGGYSLFPCWARDGRRILYSTYASDRLNLHIHDLAARKTEKISSYAGLNYGAAWSPDGTKIAMTLTKDGNAEIYLLDLETKKTTRLTNNRAIDCSPAFSPNSREIAFVSDRSGGPQVYIMDLYGGNVRRLTFHGNYNTSPAWSPRGDLVAYVSQEADNSQQIYVTDPTDFQPIRLTAGGNNEEPSWSPDGLHIVYTSTRTGRSELWTMNWDGTRARKLTQGLIANAPDWSPFLK